MIYQKLRKENLEVAKAIFTTLQQNRVISRANLKETFRDVRRMHYANLEQNFLTIEKFLKDHELVTYYKDPSSTMVFYIATKKTIHSKSFENATIEYQFYTMPNLLKAIDYLKMTNNLIPLELEGKVVAGILGLKGKIKNEFILSYKETSENLNDMNKIYESQGDIAAFDFGSRIKITLMQMKTIKKA